MEINVQNIDPNFLPKWPHVTISNDGTEYHVHGRHVTYLRLCVMDFIVRMLGYAYMIGICYFLFWRGGKALIHQMPQKDVIILFMILVACGSLTFFILPLGRYLCWLFFRKNISVRFTPEAIYIGRKRIKRTLISSVEARASIPHLSAERAASLRQKIGMNRMPDRYAYRFQFMKVEIIYGTRVFYVTSIADFNLAEQFSVALTFAWSQARETGDFDKVKPVSDITDITGGRVPE